MTTETTRHTPKPWTMEATGSDIMIFSADGCSAIARVYRYRGNDEGEGVANARLIAAAPEMTELARELILECSQLYKRLAALEADVG